MKIFAFLILLLSFGVAWAKTDYFSAQAYASNKLCIEQIIAMENAVAFVGGADTHTKPHATYSVLFKGKNGYTLSTFYTEELDENRDYKNLTPFKKFKPKEDENSAYEFSLDEAHATILLKCLEEQIALAKEKGSNEDSQAKSLNVKEVGLKLGDKWFFAGQKYARPAMYSQRKANPERDALETKHALDRYCIARKLSNIEFSPSQRWLERSIKSLAYDYRALAKEILKNTLINFEAPADEQYFCAIDFDKGETLSTFALSTKAPNPHFKIMTLGDNIRSFTNAYKLKIYKDALQFNISMRTKSGTVGRGSSIEFPQADYEYLNETEHGLYNKVDTEFSSTARIKADKSWGEASEKFPKGEPVCFKFSPLKPEGLLERLFGTREEKDFINQIDSKINSPIARFKGQKNTEFCEAFGVATFEDREMVGFWSIHINSGHTSAFCLEDNKNVEKAVYDISLEFNKDARRYSNVNLKMTDKSGTVSYIDHKGEESKSLNCLIREKTIKGDISIIRAYKDEAKKLTRVIFSGKIRP